MILSMGTSRFVIKFPTVFCTDSCDQAANVLVDDNYRCVISDFGQSEMKSEVYRITGRSGFGQSHSVLVY